MRKVYLHLAKADFDDEPEELFYGEAQLEIGQPCGSHCEGGECWSSGCGVGRNSIETFSGAGWTRQDLIDQAAKCFDAKVIVCQNRIQ